MVTIKSDQHDLLFLQEIPVSLYPIAVSPISPPSVQSFGVEYLLTEGVSSGKKCLSSRRLSSKPPKIERSTTPSSGAASSAIELIQHPRVVMIRHSYDRKQLITDVVKNELQLYFVKVINLLRDDLIDPNIPARQCLASDLGLHQLLPYFLDFIFGQMTTHYQDVVLMEFLIQLATALIRTRSMVPARYVHPLLKIAFSTTIRLSFADTLHDDDRGLRIQGAELLGEIMKRFGAEYPNVGRIVFNALVDCLFGGKRFWLRISGRWLFSNDWGIGRWLRFCRI
jgi:hypothetical protein